MSRTLWLACFIVIVAGLVVAQTVPPAAPSGTAGQENTQNSAPGTYPPPSTADPSATPNPNPSPNPPATDNPPPSTSNSPATYDQAQPPQQTSPTNNPSGQWGQRPNPAASPGTVQIPAGVIIRATLDTPLSTKTSQVGDRFTATVAEPVLDNSGQVAVPVGTKINGQVSQSEQGKTVAVLRGKGRLDLRFIDMTLPSGQSTPLTATLKQVANTSGSTQTADSEGGVQSSTSGKTAAKGVGIGAGLGTVAGLIFGSALKGLVIGAIAGGGYVLATKGKDVELPANTGLVLSLDQPLSVPAYTGGR